MPLYEYRCSKCNKLLELFRPMDNHPACCPTCYEPKGLVLLPSRSSFKLKGTGWYQTDYAGKK